MTTEIDFIKSVTTMTSLEICEITGKRHNHTCDLIKSLVDKGLISIAEFRLCSYKVNNRDQPMYELTRLASILVVAQQSPEFTVTLIKRWDELENTNQPLTRLEFAELQVVLIKELEFNKAVAERALLEVDSLETKLDEAAQWSSIKKQERLQGMKYNWQPLKAYAKANGIEIKKVFDQNYGEVNSYSADVWLAVYEVELIK